MSASFEIKSEHVVGICDVQADKPFRQRSESGEHNTIASSVRLDYHIECPRLRWLPLYQKITTPVPTLRHQTIKVRGYRVTSAPFYTAYFCMNASTKGIHNLSHKVNVCIYVYLRCDVHWRDQRSSTLDPTDQVGTYLYTV